MCQNHQNLRYTQEPHLPNILLQDILSTFIETMSKSASLALSHFLCLNIYMYGLRVTLFGVNSINNLYHGTAFFPMIIKFPLLLLSKIVRSSNSHDSNFPHNSDHYFPKSYLQLLSTNSLVVLSPVSDNCSCSNNLEISTAPKQAKSWEPSYSQTHSENQDQLAKVWFGSS